MKGIDELEGRKLDAAVAERSTVRVYVSPLQPDAVNGTYLLFSNSDDATHALAARMKLKRRHASRTSPVTYSLSLFGRRLAVELGALELSRDEFLTHVKALSL